MEKQVIAKLFYNKDLQDKYLPDILPALALSKKNKTVLFLMRELHKLKMEIIPANLLALQSSDRIAAVIRGKIKGSLLSSGDIEDILYDTATDSSPALFEELYAKLHDKLFAFFTVQVLGGIEQEMASEAPNLVLSKVRAVERFYRVVYKHKFVKRGDPIADAAEAINTAEGSLLSFSKNINFNIGGWTRGFASLVVARSQHCKSTFMTRESIFKAINLKAQVAVIAAEEAELFFWRRVFACLLKVSITDMKNQIVKITPAQVKKVRDLLQDRIKVYQENKFKNIVDLINSFNNNVDWIWIDHVNSISFPGSGSAMMNMIGGLPALVSAEVDYLKDHNKVAITNLSQVNEKELMKRTSIWKHPSYTDAYGSQVFHQHAREILTFYYPYIDVLNNPRSWTGKKELALATKEDFYVKVEKGSFGGISESKFRYIADYADFEDAKHSVELNHKSQIKLGIADDQISLLQNL